MYQKEVRTELDKTCKEVLSILDEYLLPKLPPKDTEASVFFYKVILNHVAAYRSSHYFFILDTCSIAVVGIDALVAELDEG